MRATQWQLLSDQQKVCLSQLLLSLPRMLVPAKQLIFDRMHCTCRQQPKQQLKRLYDTQDAAEGDADAGGQEEDEEEQELQAELVQRKGGQRAFPPLGRMSGLGPSDNATPGDSPWDLCQLSAKCALSTGTTSSSNALAHS